MIGQGLYQFLAAANEVVKLCQQRIYPNVAPHDAAYPFLVYSRISCQDVIGLKGPTRLTKARVQIDSYAPDYATADRLADAVRIVLNGYAGPMGPYVCKGACRDYLQDIYHPPQTADDIGLHRVRQDFWVPYEEIT